MVKKSVVIFLVSFLSLQLYAQDVINNMIKEETGGGSQLETLGVQLIDGIGPRLVGSPQMKQAHDWVISKYKAWGIPAENKQYGQWRGWERGASHADMVFPRVQSLAGRQLAWSAPTPANGITGEVILIPDAKDPADFSKLLQQVKGKIILMSALQPTGRPDEFWEKSAIKEGVDAMKSHRAALADAHVKKIAAAGLDVRSMAVALEKAGAAGLIGSYWSKAYGSNKVFAATIKTIPVFDLNLEDYGLLYRLVEAGVKPRVKLYAESKELGLQPTFNTMGTIKGKEKPNEYVVLSAHLDSWDGGTGATDNGTGTLIIMEAMRLLKKWYPNPKRTIIAGHWGSEEQGLNGSRAFVKDNSEMVKNIQAVFNQDGGTGRTNFINGAGFKKVGDFLGRWLKAIPKEITEISTDFPGTPAGGGSDNASFVAAGIPSFYLGTNNWDYGTVTWHTNLDTYDKIVFDDLRRSVLATAILAYMASEDPARASTEKITVTNDGKPVIWPAPKDGNRKGGVE